MKSARMGLVLCIVCWFVVAVQTLEMVRKHFQWGPTFVTWLMFIMLAALWTLPILGTAPVHKWPLKARVLTALLLFSGAGYVGYDLYRQDSAVHWVAAFILLPMVIWLALRRWTPWQWAKSQWTLFGLVMAGTAIGLWLAVALKA